MTGPGSDTGSDAVAVVGMAGRFPDAPDVAALWELLRSGRSAIRRFSPEELVAAGVDPAAAADPAYVPAGTVAPDIDRFDAGFFGTTPAEARLIDPQHRVFLEAVWAALEDAAVPPSAHDRRTGVWASTSQSSYLLHNVLSHPEHAAAPFSYPVLLGNDKDFLATRVAHRLDLRGPALTVQTACSSSLVAVHLACQSLLEGECSVAVAGGVSLLVPQGHGYRYREGGILSRDGTCRPFDAAAGGTVKGNGCGVVVLRRLADALADGDRVYAVVAGTAIGNDGAGKVGFTAPGPAGQTAVLREALAFAGLTGADVDHVEAHGTGTPLGDPVEVRSLAAAYGAAAPGSISLSSVKGALGHLDAAAGVTGLIAAALVLHHGHVPPQAGFRSANPELRLAATPFTVPEQGRDGPVRAAAVSSFGIGGTNAHAVLTAAPDRPARPAPRGEHSVTVSTRGADQLADAVRRLVDHLDAVPGLRPDDLAMTLARRRDPEPHAMTVTGSTTAEVRAALAGWLAGDRAPTGRPDVPTGAWEHARAVALPGHPLRRERHWLDPAAPAARPAAAAAPAATAPVEPVAPDVLAVVLELVRDGLGLPDAGPDDDYAELGGDSFAAVEIVSALAERCGARLGLAEFQQLGTARAVAARLGELLAATPAAAPRDASPLVVVRAGEGPARFLVHPAGGTTTCYSDLARYSRDPAPLRAIAFPPELVDRLRTVEEVAGHHLRHVRAVQPRGPYRLGGYSFGGAVAFEMALRLQEAGEAVEELVLIDALPPAAYRPVPPERALAAFPAVMDAVLGVPTPAGTPLPTTVEEAAALARRPGWSEATQAEFTRFLRVWLAHLAALTVYRPAARLAGDVVVLDAAEPFPPRLVELLGMRDVPKRAWAEHVAGRLRVVTVPGDHYSMMADPARLADLAAVYDEVVTGVAVPQPR